MAAPAGTGKADRDTAVRGLFSVVAKNTATTTNRRFYF
jgi:hypothetical protein